MLFCKIIIYFSSTSDIIRESWMVVDSVEQKLSSADLDSMQFSQIDPEAKPAQFFNQLARTFNSKPDENAPEGTKQYFDYHLEKIQEAYDDAIRIGFDIMNEEPPQTYLSSDLTASLSLLANDEYSNITISGPPESSPFALEYFAHLSSKKSQKDFAQTLSKLCFSNLEIIEDCSAYNEDIDPFIKKAPAPSLNRLVKLLKKLMLRNDQMEWMVNTCASQWETVNTEVVSLNNRLAAAEAAQEFHDRDMSKVNEIAKQRAALEADREEIYAIHNEWGRVKLDWELAREIWESEKLNWEKEYENKVIADKNFREFMDNKISVEKDKLLKEIETQKKSIEVAKKQVDDSKKSLDDQKKKWEREKQKQSENLSSQKETLEREKRDLKSSVEDVTKRQRNLDDTLNKLSNREVDVKVKEDSLIKEKNKFLAEKENTTKDLKEEKKKIQLEYECLSKEKTEFEILKKVQKDAFAEELKLQKKNKDDIDIQLAELAEQKKKLANDFANLEMEKSKMHDTDRQLRAKLDSERFGLLNIIEEQKFEINQTNMELKEIQKQREILINQVLTLQSQNSFLIEQSNIKQTDSTRVFL